MRLRVTRTKPIAAVVLAAFAAIAIAPEVGLRVHRHAHDGDAHVHVEDLLGRSDESAHEHDHSVAAHHHHVEHAHPHSHDAEPWEDHHDPAAPGHHQVAASAHASALAAAEPADHVHAGHRFLLVAQAAPPALAVRLLPEARSALETARAIRRAQLAARARAPPSSPLTSI